MKKIILLLLLPTYTFSQGYVNFGGAIIPRKKEASTSVFEKQEGPVKKVLSHVSMVYGGGYTTKFKKNSISSLITMEVLIFRPFSAGKEVPFFAQARLAKGMKVNKQSFRHFDILSFTVGYSLTNQPKDQDKTIGNGLIIGVNYLSDLSKALKVKYEISYSNHYFTPSIGAVVQF